jgi:hypothetical protein
VTGGGGGVLGGGGGGGGLVGIEQSGLLAPFVQQYSPRPPLSQQSALFAPFSQQYFPNPPLTQQSGYAKSGAPFEHLGFGGGGGGGGRVGGGGGGLVGGGGGGLVGGVANSSFFVTVTGGRYSFRGVVLAVGGGGGGRVGGGGGGAQSGLLYPLVQQYCPFPPLVQQSGYAKSGAPFEHLGGGLVGGGGGGLVGGGGGGRVGGGGGGAQSGLLYPLVQQYCPFPPLVQQSGYA